MLHLAATFISFDMAAKLVSSGVCSKPVSSRMEL